MNAARYDDDFGVGCEWCREGKLKRVGSYTFSTMWACWEGWGLTEFIILSDGGQETTQLQMFGFKRLLIVKEPDLGGNIAFVVANLIIPAGRVLVDFGRW